MAGAGKKDTISVTARGGWELSHSASKKREGPNNRKSEETEDGGLRSDSVNVTMN